MKLFLIYIFLLIFPGIPDFPDQEFPGEKRIEKRMVKIWDSENLSLRITDFTPGSDPEGKLFEIQEEGSLKGFLYQGIVYTCGSNGCEAPSPGEEREYFCFFLLSDNKGKVLHTEITLYAATHGHEVASRGWLKQFRDYQGNTGLEYGKNIDALTGATTSGKNLTEEVEMIVSGLKEYIQSDTSDNHSL